MTNIHTDLSIVPVGTAPSPATSGTQLKVTDANAALLPSVYPWWGLIKASGEAPTRANSEIVKVVSGVSSAGNTDYTIVRAQGIPVTTARSIVAGDDFYEAHTAQKQTDTENIALTGWYTISDSWAYASADTPTFTITVPSGAASKYTVGMRVKLTQTTVKYFIVTAVADTVLTVYGGTDYTLIDAAISAISVSNVKAPNGFPMSPAKWTVSVISTTNFQQNTPTQNQWYNDTNLNLSIPIGAWNIEHKTYPLIVDGASGSINILVTLSTANNTESDKSFTSGHWVRAAYDGAELQGGSLVFNRNFLQIAAKATYYTNIMAPVTNINAIYNLSSNANSFLRAVCAYL